jgi:hypothetical protein
VFTRNAGFEPCQEFASKTKVKFAADLSPQALAYALGEVAPADALTVLRKAINCTFHYTGGARPVAMADINKAIASTQI